MASPDRLGFLLALLPALALWAGEKGLPRRLIGLAAAAGMGAACDLLTFIPAVLVLALLGGGGRWRRGFSAVLLLLGLAALAPAGPAGVPLHDFATLRAAAAAGGGDGAGLVLVLLGGMAAWMERLGTWGGVALLTLLLRVMADLAPPSGFAAALVLLVAPAVAGAGLCRELAGRREGVGTLLAAEALLGLGVGLLARSLDRPDLAAPAFTAALGLAGLAALIPFAAGTLPDGAEAGGLAPLVPFPLPGAAGAGFLGALAAAALALGREAPLSLFPLAAFGALLLFAAGPALARAFTLQPPGAAVEWAFFAPGALPALPWALLAPFGARLAGAPEPPRFPLSLALLALVSAPLLLFLLRMRKSGEAGEGDVPLPLIRPLARGTLDEAGMGRLGALLREGLLRGGTTLLALGRGEGTEEEG